MGPRPAHDIPAMLAKYPRAAAYLKAEAWARGAHYAKVAAGKAALEKIIQGEDFAAALAEMEAAWPLIAMSTPGIDRPKFSGF